MRGLRALSPNASRVVLLPCTRYSTVFLLVMAPTHELELWKLTTDQTWFRRRTHRPRRGPHGAGRLSRIGSAWIRVQSGSERFGAVPGASLGLAWSHARGARVSEPILLWRFLLGCDRPRRSPIPPAPVADPARAGRRSRARRRRGGGGGVGVGISVGCIIYIFETPVEAVV